MMRIVITAHKLKRCADGGSVLDIHLGEAGADGVPVFVAIPITHIRHLAAAVDGAIDGGAVGDVLLNAMMTGVSTSILSEKMIKESKNLRETMFDAAAKKDQEELIRKEEENKQYE